MGMDVFGIHPIAECGKYFRNSIWYWHPLWDFIGVVCADVVTDGDRDEGHWNNGHVIDGAKAKAIGERLTKLLKMGDVAKYAKKYGSAVRWSCFTEENVKEFADFCTTSGGFRIC